MIMFKAFSRYPYKNIKLLFNRVRYFLLPNLLSKATMNYETIPLCQQRTFITGKGIIHIGKECRFGYKLGGFHYGGSIEIQARTLESRIIIGSQVSTNNNIFICAAGRIEIGENTLIGQNVSIMDFEAHGISPNDRSMIGKIGSVTIGENVWIGNNVSILKNTTIGENSIVAAGAVVAGQFPSNVIIDGIPAKIIKENDA